MACPDAALLVPLKRSGEYRKIRSRVIDRKPADGWQEEGLHYFVFELFPADGAAPGADARFALFTMRPGEPAPVCAVLVTPPGPGNEVELVDLRRPDHAFMMGL